MLTAPASLTGPRDRGRLDAEDGVTLIELLVVMFFLGIIGVITMNGFLSMTQTSRAAHQRVDALDDLRPAVQRVTRELRAAEPLVLDPAGNYNDKIGVELTRDGTRQQFWYYLEGDPGDLSLRADHLDVARRRHHHDPPDSAR